jgi:hypothetical protein
MLPPDWLSCNSNQSQSERKVSRDTKAIETPKILSYGFNPAVSCLHTLVFMKRVLGVPLANEISELKAQPKRVNSH